MGAAVATKRGRPLAPIRQAPPSARGPDYFHGKEYSGLRPHSLAIGARRHAALLPGADQRARRQARGHRGLHVQPGSGAATNVDPTTTCQSTRLGANRRGTEALDISWRKGAQWACSPASSRSSTDIDIVSDLRDRAPTSLLRPPLTVLEDKRDSSVISGCQNVPRFSPKWPASGFAAVVGDGLLGVVHVPFV